MSPAWPQRLIGDVASVFDGPHATPKTVDSGPIFLGISALQDGAINLKEARHLTEADFVQWTRRVRPKEGDVVFSYETRLGQIAVIPGDLECCLGRRMGLIRFERDQVLPRFFAYQYMSPDYQAYIAAKTIKGATVDRISIKEFPSFPVAAPDLDVQHRIVTLLDEAFEGIAAAKAHAEQNLRNAKSLITTRLAQLFRPDHDMDRLADLAISISDGDHAPPPKASAGVPFITISNIDKENRQIDFSETFLVSQAYFDELKTHRRPQPGDVLYTVTGSFGIPVLVEEDRAFCFQRHIGLVRPKPDVDGKWLSYALLSPMAFAQADAGATGTAQRTVSLNVLRNMQMPKLPIEEQRRQARELDALATEVARLASIYQRKLTALTELRQSLLHQAFTGQL